MRRRRRTEEEQSGGKDVGKVEGREKKASVCLNPKLSGDVGVHR